MNSWQSEYDRLVRKHRLTQDPSFTDGSVNDSCTWLELADRIMIADPDDALWCFKTAMELDITCHQAFEGAGRIMEGRNEYLKAIGYYSLAYSPALLNYQILEHMAALYRKTNMAEFYASNLSDFAYAIKNNRHIEVEYDHNLHNEILGQLKRSRFARFTNDADKKLGFASATAYDIYRLPDGRRNPTKRPDTSFHVTMAPSPADLTLALRRVVAPLIKDEERWLLKVPMVALDVFHVFPFVFLHPTKGPVVVIPLGTFGSLFAVNEILVMSQMMKDEGEKYLEASAETLKSFLTGQGRLDKMRELMPLMIRPEIDIVLNQQVWRRTVIHQTFMLLHEFGHIALGHVALERGTTSFLGSFRGNRSRTELRSRWWFPGKCDQEVAADDWAGRHLFGGIPGVEYARGGAGWLDEEIKELIALLAFLELYEEEGSQGTISPLDRWKSVAKGLSILNWFPGVMEEKDRADFEDVKKYLSRSVDHPSSSAIQKKEGAR